MRCRVTKCIHNEDGYCYRESYVEIDENGECDEMCVLYHIADLLSEAGDRLEDCYNAFVFIYSEKDVPEDVRRKLL